MTLLGILGFVLASTVMAGVLGAAVARHGFDGQWRERFRCGHCKGIQIYNWRVCPECGENMGNDWESVTARAVGLSGWEVRERHARVQQPFARDVTPPIRPPDPPIIYNPDKWTGLN